MYALSEVCEAFPLFLTIIVLSLYFFDTRDKFISLTFILYSHLYIYLISVYFSYCTLSIHLSICLSDILPTLCLS